MMTASFLERAVQLLGGGTIRSALTARERVKKAAEGTDGKVNDHGGDRKSESSSKLELETIEQRAMQNGISKAQQFKIDKLAREFPELHEQVKDGELSVHRASIEAGFVTEKTTAEKLIALWQKATPEERHEFPEQMK